MRIDSTDLLKQLNILNKTDILSGMDVGDTIRAQVMNISSKTLSLRLPDGTIIDASSLINLDVNIGDFLELMVNNKSSSQLFVEIVQGNVQESTEINELKKMLMMLNVPFDDKNIKIAQQMVKNHVSFTKGNFQMVSDLMQQHKGVTLDTITFLLGNEVTVNNKNITLLTNMVHHQQLLGDQLKELILEFSKLDSAKKASNYVIQTDHHGQEQNTGTQKGSVLRNGFVSQMNTDTLTTSTQQNAIYSKQDNQQMSANHVGYSNDKMQVDYSQHNNNTKDLSVLQKLIDIKQSIDNPILQKKSHIPLNGEFDRNLASDVGEQQSKNLTDVVRTLFQIINRSKVNNLHHNIRTDRLLEDLSNTLNSIKQEIENINMSEKQPILHIITDIEDNLRFLEQINKFTTLIQIPIDINGNHTTAELYVCKNPKKKNKLDPSNATVLLSLFTANLGQVEVIVNVNKKNIECSFRLEQQEILEFIRSNSTSLYNLLDAQGYKLTKVSYKHIDKDEHVNLLNAENIKNNENRKYSFDMRV